MEKFEINESKSIDRVRRNVVQCYVEGLCWIMRYYYQGVCSWQWFYPYHYAPFASDLKGLADLEITFFLGQPFKPFDQLMGTLPAASSNALPKHYGALMTDPKSPLSSFYPDDFEIDMNGKRLAWQGVAKLPFIDERRLLAETKKLEDTLTEEEKFRNRMMFDILYVHVNHPLASQVYTLYQIGYQLSFQEAQIIPIDANVSDGMNGFLCLCERNFYSISILAPVKGLSSLENNQVLNATYLNPTYHQHIPEPPAGVILAKKVLKPQDIKPFPVLWHEDNSSRHQAGRERSQLSVAVSGPHLGAAAHRLLKNTLQLKTNNSGLLETPYRNALHPVHKPRPNGPSSVYERSFVRDLNYYQYSNHKPRDFPNSRSAQIFNETQCSRQNLRIQERSKSQDQQQSIYVGMSNLKIEEQKNRQERPKMPDDKFSSNQKQPIQNGPPPPLPPSNWLHRQPVREPSGGCSF